MKIIFGSVVVLLLCTSWICAAEQNKSPVDMDEQVLPVTTESASTDPQDLEVIVPAQISAEELEQESEAANTIESETRPTKRPKRPHSNKRPDQNSQHHHSPMTLTPGSWPYFPMTAQMPYPTPFSYPQPIFYTMPMYSPYFYSPQINSPEKKRPVNAVQMDTEESSESEEEVNAEELLRKGNLSNKRIDKKPDDKEESTNVKPTKRFHIKNWVANKLHKKTSSSPPP